VLPCSALVSTVWGISRVLLRISIWFFCHVLDFTSRNERLVLLLLRRRTKRFSVFLYSDRALPSTAVSWCVMFTRPISCARSTLTVAATARPICRTLCTGASLTTDKLSAVSYGPLTHCRHNAGDRSAKVGHKIIWISLVVMCKFLKSESFHLSGKIQICNSIFLRYVGMNEVTLLHLQQAHSLSVLTYAIPAYWL